MNVGKAERNCIKKKKKKGIWFETDLQLLRFEWASSVFDEQFGYDVFVEEKFRCVLSESILDAFLG